MGVVKIFPNLKIDLDQANTILATGTYGVMHSDNNDSADLYQRSFLADFELFNKKMEGRAGSLVELSAQWITDTGEKSYFFNVLVGTSANDPKELLIEEGRDWVIAKCPPYRQYSSGKAYDDKTEIEGLMMFPPSTDI